MAMLTGQNRSGTASKLLDQFEAIRIAAEAALTISDFERSSAHIVDIPRQI
jgi:hypothetical protein